MTESAYEQYLEEMSRPGHWGDGIVLSAAVKLYGRPIIIHTVQGEQLIDTPTEPEVKNEPLQLGLINGNHYLSIHTTQHPRDSMEIDHPDNNSTVLEEENSISDESMESPQCYEKTEPPSQDIRVGECVN